MVLLSHFHSLSSFVFSCGLTQKLDGLSSPKLKTPPAALSTPQTPTMETGVPYNVVVTGVSLVGFAQQHQLPPQSINAATQQQQTQTQPQKTVLSEITLNNNNNNNNNNSNSNINTVDHSTSHQVYCNNNATASGGGVAAVGVTTSSSTAGGVTANAAGAGAAAVAASTNSTVNGVNRLNGKNSFVFPSYT